MIYDIDVWFKLKFEVKCHQTPDYVGVLGWQGCALVTVWGVIARWCLESSNGRGPDIGGDSRHGLSGGGRRQPQWAAGIIPKL